MSLCYRKNHATHHKETYLQLQFKIVKGHEGNEIGGKMCNSRVQELLVPCESPHETKDKCMVIYVFGLVHALINGFVDKCEFADILKHQSMQW